MHTQNTSTHCDSHTHMRTYTFHKTCRAVASGPVGPVLAGPTFGAGGCGKRQSVRATCEYGAGGGEIES